MELKLSDKTLAVFVDDTGHEALVPGHPVYGLGGCAVMAPDLDRVIRHPWRDVRRGVTGSTDTPLHASSFGQTATRGQIEIVADFFQRQPFARIGAILTVNTQLTGAFEPISIIAGVLKNRVADIAKWTRFTEVKVIFESSGRADRLVEAAFGDFGIEETGNWIPVECYFMPKAAHDPALEVADFIVQPIGRRARRKIEGRQEYAPDFAAVFHGIDPRLVSYMEVIKAERNA